jgi:hypothetical protein
MLYFKHPIRFYKVKLLPLLKQFWHFVRSKKRFWLSILIFVLLGLLLLYEYYAGTYEKSHTYILAFIYVISMLFWHVLKIRHWFKTFIDFMGLEQLFSNSGVFRFYVSAGSAFLISSYLLLGSSNADIPPGLQFSIIPVTATLGGLVIAGANNSKLSTPSRNELLRVSQNFIVATLSFIFFTATFSLANIGPQIDPNMFPPGEVERIRFVIYWISIVLFLAGTTLFAVGIIDLSLALRKIKNELLTKR